MKSIRKIFVLSFGVLALTDFHRALADDCQRLETPASYYNKRSKSYLLAVDSCQLELFTKLGFKAKKKPQSKYRYANLTNQYMGFPNNAHFYSEKLKLIYETMSEDNVYSEIVAALGFKEGHPVNESDYTRSDRDLILDVQVCCHPQDRVLVACSAVDSTARFRHQAEFGLCPRNW